MCLDFLNDNNINLFMAEAQLGCGFIIILIVFIPWSVGEFGNSVCKNQANSYSLITTACYQSSAPHSDISEGFPKVSHLICGLKGVLTLLIRHP